MAERAVNIETEPNFHFVCASADDQQQSSGENSMTNISPAQNKNQQQRETPAGWVKLEKENPEYGQKMLSSYYKCSECCKSIKTKLKPHCLCSQGNERENSSAVGAEVTTNRCSTQCPISKQECPDKKNTAKGNGSAQRSHCPLCLCISRGISHHPSYSTHIDLYCCANCEVFYLHWSNKGTEDNWKAWKKFKCVKSKHKELRGKWGKCFKDWNFEEKASRCTWCRMRMMELLGLDMNENLKQALQSPDFGIGIKTAFEEQERTDTLTNAATSSIKRKRHSETNAQEDASSTELSTALRKNQSEERLNALIDCLSNVFIIQALPNEPAPSAIVLEQATDEGLRKTLYLPSDILGPMMSNLNADISTMADALRLPNNDSVSKWIEKVRGVNTDLLAQNVACQYNRRCACGVSAGPHKPDDPSHFIFDFLIRIGWICSVPEAERKRYIPEWNRYIEPYGRCCSEGRFTTPRGFQYLIDTGKINPLGRHQNLYNRLSSGLSAFRELVTPDVDSNEFWCCQFCSREYERDAAHLLAHFLYKLGMLTDEHIQVVEDGPFSTAGCQSGQQLGLPIRANDLLKIFVYGVYRGHFDAYSDDGFDLYANKVYKQVIDPRKFGKRENERIPIGSAKALFDGSLNGKHCFMICIRPQDLERSCNFGTVNECLVGTVGFHGFMRVYFIPTKAYVDWLVLQNRSKHQVRIEELEEMPTTTASHGVDIGGVGQWQQLDITNGCSSSNVPVPTQNTTFSMIPSADCHRNQAATFANSSEHFHQQQIPISHSQFLLQNHQQIAFVPPSSSSTIMAPIMESYVNNGLINNQQLVHNASFYHSANNHTNGNGINELYTHEERAMFFQHRQQTGDYDNGGDQSYFLISSPKPSESTILDDLSSSVDMNDYDEEEDEEEDEDDNDEEEDEANDNDLVPSSSGGAV